MQVDAVQNKSFSWGNLLMGVLFIVVALVSFRNPMADLIFLALMFGFTALINGAWLIANRHDSTFRLVVGILDIVVGLIFIFNLGLSTAVMPFLFAFWFLANAVANLFYIGYAKRVSQGFYWLMLVLNILAVILGVVLLFDPITSTLTIAFLVGFYFMLTGFEFIMEAFN